MDETFDRLGLSPIPTHLGGELVRRGYLEAGDLADLLALAFRTGQRLGDVVVAQKMLSRDDLNRCLADLLGLPVIDLQTVVLDPHVAELIPEALARRFLVLAIGSTDEGVVLAMDDPTAQDQLAALAIACPFTLVPAFTVGGDLREAINLAYGLDEHLRVAISSLGTSIGTTETHMAAMSERTPIESPAGIIVDNIIQHALLRRSSDIHFEPTPNELIVRTRVDGYLTVVIKLPKLLLAPLAARIKVLSGMDIADQRRPQDGHMVVNYDGRHVDIRVASVGTRHGEMLVLRLLSSSETLLSLSALGMDRREESQIQEALSSPFGLIIVSGPTGSGKTTTLYAMMQYLDRYKRNIMTIEDPIEYDMESVNQIQVNRQAGMTFSSGLRTILRLDPDVILVGEIRDSETAAIAVQAALTGHLVLTTVHANDAAAAMVRLVQLGVEPFLLSSATVASIAQRLVRKLCPHCGADRPRTRLEDNLPSDGCNFCAHTGFLGRTGIFEILSVSETVRDLITARAAATRVRQVAIAEGMVPMHAAGRAKVEQGITSMQELNKSAFALDQ